MKHPIDVVPATRPVKKLPVRSFRKSGIDRTGVTLAQQSVKVLAIGVGQKADQAVFKFQRCAVVEFSQTPKRGGQRSAFGGREFVQQFFKRSADGFWQTVVIAGEEIGRSELQSQSNIVCRLLLEKKQRH